MRSVRYSLDSQRRTCTVDLANRDLVLMISNHDLAWIAVALGKVIMLVIRCPLGRLALAGQRRSLRFVACTNQP